MRPKGWEGDSHAKIFLCRKSGICKGLVTGKNFMYSRNWKKTSPEEGMEGWEFGNGVYGVGVDLRSDCGTV